MAVAPNANFPSSRPNWYRFRVSTGWLIHVFKMATRRDHDDLLPALMPLLARDAVVIDVGAHGGQFARLFSTMVPDGRVVAVEPSGYARSILRVVAWLHGLNNVLIIAAALGSSPGVAILRTPLKRRGDVGYGLSSLRLGERDDRPQLWEAVAVVSLDQLVAALELARVDLIKADIEGFEPELISGGRLTLQRHRPALLLEMDQARLAVFGFELDLFWAELEELGYRPYRIPSRGHPTPHLSGPVTGDILWLHSMGPVQGLS
ncbi:MAG: hypothetical protein JWR00_1076 [Rubritepida sp.]|nr:hypothetical protein [Rubritepida sp.]